MSDETRQFGLTWTKRARSTEWEATVGAFSAFVLDEPGDTRFSYVLRVNMNGWDIDLPHNDGDADDRPWFPSVDEAMQAAERKLAAMGVSVVATAAPAEHAALEQKHNALVSSLADAFCCFPADVEATGKRIAERSRKRGAVAGELLPQVGMLHAHARTLAQLVLDGDDRAKDLALGLLGRAQAIEERFEAGAVIGLRGWWATLLVESCAHMLHGKHEALLQAALDMDTREGPVTIILRRGRSEDLATDTERRNTELARRVEMMARLLDTFIGLSNASLALDDLDSDEIERGLQKASDEWSALSLAMKRSPITGVDR